jgi:molecular chaperone GrpE
VLADFRRWLEEVATSEPEALATGRAAVAHASGSDVVDLATVVGAFTALRHEVNLQTKATRAQSEQFAQALEALRQPAQPNDDAAIRPLVKALTEAYGTLTRTTTEIDRLRQTTAESPSFWDRLFRRASTVPARLAAAVTGLQMSERRIEQLMRDVGLEPVEVVGKPFDPETMEAVEAIASGEHLSGTVVEELRRGYRWRGRVFRFAQVRVAK